MRATPWQSSFPPEAGRKLSLIHIWFNRLVELVNQISAEKNAAYTGRVEKVLVEGPDKNGKGILAGRTDGFKPVSYTHLDRQ